MSEHDKGTLQTGPNARQRGYAGDLSQMDAPQIKEGSQSTASDQGAIADLEGQEIRCQPSNSFSEDQFNTMSQGNQGHHDQNFL
uniref:Uncharacterized protein n=1 Tax=Acrobeloides nanus TaxID=290746 RepID=A0A914C6W5_9BILA